MNAVCHLHVSILEGIAHGRTSNDSRSPRGGKTPCRDGKTTCDEQELTLPSSHLAIPVASVSRSALGHFSSPICVHRLRPQIRMVFDVHRQISQMAIYLTNHIGVRGLQPGLALHDFEAPALCSFCAIRAPRLTLRAAWRHLRGVVRTQGGRVTCLSRIDEPIHRAAAERRRGLRVDPEMTPLRGSVV